MKDRHDMFKELMLYNHEIEVIKKMCALALQDDKFDAQEKETIENILDNDLV